MKNPVIWKIAGLVVLAIVLANIVLGLNLLPSPAVAREKNTFIPLVITWALICVGVFSGLTLAGFLLTAKRASR